jgi:hypothetical protein
MDVTTLRRPRTLTPEEASDLVGLPVDPAPGNVATPTIVVDDGTGEPVVAYLPVPDPGVLRAAVVPLDFGGTSGGQVRADGLRIASRTFGYGPRRPVYRREGCNVTSLEVDAPTAHHAVMAYATRLREVLEEVAPGVTDASAKVMTEVTPDWKLGESEWTSGVINSSARLPYHRDAMNFPVWSAMPVLRRHMTGGHLAIPEYDLVLPCRDGWGVFFPGYQLVHGVTPMRATRPGGYRYSLVYYALRGMQDCFTYAVEREYARTRRTERERDIARRLVEDPDAPPIALTGGLPPGRPGTGYARETPEQTRRQRELSAAHRAARTAAQDPE